MYQLVQGIQRHVAGAIKDRPSAVAAPRLPVLGPIPPISDLRYRMPPVTDQGGLGACAPHAILEAYEALERAPGAPFVAGQAAPPPSYTLWARRFQYYWARLKGGYPADQDTGSMLCDNISVLTDIGAVEESLWPYIDDGKAFAIQPPFALKESASAHKALIAYRCAGANQKPAAWIIKASLAQGFPVAIGAVLPASFMSDETAATGIVTPPEPGETSPGGHALCVVGHDDTKNRFLLQNSWGTSWGDSGYCYWPYSMTNQIQDAHTLRKGNV